jgi:probable HAF family extracellular repeat protein
MQFRQSSSLRFIASAVALLTGFTITQALRLNDSVVTASAQAGYNITDLGTLGGVESRAYGLNALGQVAGYSPTPNEKPHAFMWDGMLHDLGTLPNAQESFAWAINDAGQVVGASSDLGSPTTRAFLWQNGQMTDTGEFSPRTINNRGEVAGSLNVKRKNVPWTEHACLWRDGALTDPGTPG